MNRNHLSRWDFIKLMAVGGGATVALSGCAGDTQPVIDLTSPPTETNGITEFADISTPLPYKPEDFKTDKLGVLSEGWDNNPWSTSSNIPYDLRDYEKTASQTEWLNYSRNNIPTVEQIPKGVLNTPPLEAIIHG